MSDAQTAYDLDPTVNNGTYLAQLMSKGGDGAAALALLAQFDVSGDERIQVMQFKAFGRRSGGARAGRP